MERVYLDNNATTPLDPRVREAMLPWLGELHGNPSSIHHFGQLAQEAVEEARSQVAALVGGRPEEIVFFSSGTEANNAMLWHIARSCDFKGHIVLSTLEHPSIRVTAQELLRTGMHTSVVAPGPSGVVTVEEIVDASRPDTVLVCLMLANNEIGTLQPVAEVAEECRKLGVPVHCDAVQGVGKVEVDVEAMKVDTLTLAPHKFHGPLGVAALWVGSDIDLNPWLLGGSQERRRRASTENVPSLVGFGEIARLAREELPSRSDHLLELRDRFEEALQDLVGLRIHCSGSPRLPNTSHIAVDGVQGQLLTIRLDLDGYAVSTGAACASGVVEPSQLLLSMGMTPDEALGSLRISFGMGNTSNEVDAFVVALAAEAQALRARAPGAGS